MKLIKNTKLIVFIITLVFVLGGNFIISNNYNPLTFLIRTLDVSASTLTCDSDEVYQYFYNKYYDGSLPLPHWTDYMSCTTVAIHTWDTYNNNAASYNTIACGSTPEYWSFTCAQVQERLAEEPSGVTVPYFSKLFLSSTGDYNSFQIQANEKSCQEDGNESYQCSSCSWELRPGYTFTCDFSDPTSGSGPTVTLTANPTSVTPGGNSTLTWSVSNADTCTASGNWSGSKSASGGSEFRSSITSNQTYILTCTNSSGSSSDTATVSTDGSSGTGPNFTYTLTALPDSGDAPLNGVDARNVVRISDSCSTGSPSDADKCTIDYKVDCTNDGTWDGTIPSYNGVINNFNYTRTAADICDYPTRGTYTMKGQVTVTQNGTGAYRTQERTVPITVNSAVVPPPSLTYDLEAGLDLATASDSFVGDAPVTGLDAVHYMNIQGCGTETSPYEDKCTLEYRVDCTNDGTWDEPQITFEHGWNDGVWKAWNYQVADICDYPSAGNYTMRGEVRVTKNGDPSLVAVGGDFVSIVVNEPDDGGGDDGDDGDGTGGASDPNLTVIRSGQGDVTSNPSGIDCGASCSSTFTLNSSVTLTATPRPGWIFTGWAEDCSGVSTQCTLIMNDPKSVKANFRPDAEYEEF